MMLTMNGGEWERFSRVNLLGGGQEQELKQEYHDLIDEYERITRLLLDELTAMIVAEFEMGLTYPDHWRRSLQRLAEAILRSPSLIQCAAAPTGCELLVKLYHSWAGYCESLGTKVLDWVHALESGHPCRASICLDQVEISLAAIQAHTAARIVCLEALGVESSAGYYSARL